MPKGAPNKRYTTEFKKMVVETMRIPSGIIYKTAAAISCKSQKIISTIDFWNVPKYIERDAWDRSAIPDAANCANGQGVPFRLCRSKSRAYSILPEKEAFSSPLRFPKTFADEMLTEAGVKVLFHTRFVAPIVDNNRIRQIILYSEAGLQAVEATMSSI